MMYFKLYPKGQDYKYGYLGVAAAISPTGPFTYSHKFLGADSPYGSGDFCIYKDDDGKVYHFTVRKPDKAFVAGELNKEYTYPQGKYKVVTGITNETEAPAIFKHKGTYYLLGSGSSGWKPNAARIFTSKSITGDYTKNQIPVMASIHIMDLAPKKLLGDNHPSLFLYKERKIPILPCSIYGNRKCQLKDFIYGYPLKSKLIV